MIGEAKAPPWLNVEQGLLRCGFEPNLRGRIAFHDFVCTVQKLPRSAILTGGTEVALRRSIRKNIGTTLEISSTALTTTSSNLYTCLIGSGDHLVLRPRFTGTPFHALTPIAQKTGIPITTIASADRRRKVVAARTMALVLWTHYLHRPQVEMCSVLGISSGAASKLLRRAAERQWPSTAELQTIAEFCRNTTHTTSDEFIYSNDHCDERDVGDLR